MGEWTADGIPGFTVVLLGPFVGEEILLKMTFKLEY